MGRWIPFSGAALGTSKRRKGENTTALFPTFFRGGLVLVLGPNDVSNFDGYRIAGCFALGRSGVRNRHGGNNHGGSGHGGATTRRDAAPREFNIIWGDKTADALLRRGLQSGDAKRGAYRVIARNIEYLVKRHQKGSKGSASLLAKDPS